jgi:hypothetical protein
LRPISRLTVDRARWIEDAIPRIDWPSDATSPEDLTHAEVECRRRVLAEFERLRQER